MIARILLVITGALMAAYGVVRLVTSARAVAVRSAIAWFLGGALAHDLLIAPAVIVVGAGLARWCPSGIRPYLQSGLIATGGVTLVAIPVLTGKGYSDKVPSALPLDYRHGYLLTVACVWAVVVLSALLTWGFRRSRRRRRPAAGTTLPVHR